MKNKINTKKNYLYEIQNGIKNIKNKKYDKAEKNFQRAILIEKINYSAYLNLSNLFLIIDERDKAIATLLSYLEEINFTQEIADLLLKIYFEYNYNSEIEKFFKKFDIDKLLEKNKRYNLYYIKAKYYEKINIISKSINFYKKSINSNSNISNVYINFFDVLERSNNLEILNKYLDLAEKFDNEDFNFFRIKYFKAFYLYRKKSYLPSEQIIKNFNLVTNLNKDKFFNYKILDLNSKNNDKIGNYKKSLNAILKRNNFLITSFDNFKHGSYLLNETINKYKNFYNKDFSNNTQLNNLSFKNKLFFLVGFPRSGTTLLDSILRSHSKTIIIEEKPYLLNCRHEYFKNNNNNLKSILNIEKSTIIDLRKKYLDQINAEYNVKDKIIVDKFPLSIVELGFIKIIFPEAKIIFSIRHPCDVILSCFFSSFKINEAMYNFLDWNSTIKFYNNVLSLFEIYENSLKQNIHYIKYEEVVIDFKKSITNLLKFMNLNFEDKLYNFYETATDRVLISTPSYSQVTNPLYKSSIGKWKNYKTDINPEKQVLKWIRKFDY